MPRLKPPITENATLAEAIESWGYALEATGKSPKTVDIYLWSVRRFETWMIANGRTTQLDRIRLTDHERFQTDMLANTRPASAAIVFRSLNVFWKWAITRPELGVTKSPMVGLSAPHVPEEHIQEAADHVSDDELRRILATCRSGSRHDFLALRDSAIIRILATTGLRLSEATNLTLDSFDSAARTLTVIGKGRRRREVFLDPDTMDALRAYLTRGRPRHAEAEHTNRLWLGGGGRSMGKTAPGVLTSNGVAQMLASRAESAKIGRRVHPHELRHYWADTVLAAGMSEGEAMQLGGWRSRALLDRYAQAGAGRRALESARQLAIAGRLPRL